VTLRTALTALTTLAVTGAGVAAAPIAPAAAADAPRHITYRQWNSARQLRTGAFSGTGLSHGRVLLTTPTRSATVAGHRYAYGSWTSPWAHPGFGLTELVPSWSATTPAGTLVQVAVRGVSLSGRRSSWDVVGRWAGTDATFHRTSLGVQRDDLAHVATDTWEASGGSFRAWQVRVSLLRRVGTASTPQVGWVGAMVSALPHVDGVTTSKPGVARGVVLPVPRYSQMVHTGEYPRFGGGGEAWCSPTSTTMVLAYYHRLPPSADYAWVSRTYADRVVDQTARMTYDYGYDGTGNWPFNTAYAARRTGRAFVTRFRSLRGVERFIRAGIPVVASITFGAGQLSGAPIRATNGHLVVVVGFTKSGDVVVNDPAAATRAGVRRTYRRDQFEDAWLKRYPSGTTMRGSGGLGYVIRDSSHPLPARTGNTNW
jgi:hypothetical protein